MARILIGVSGGIAAYKAVEFARLATQAGHGVRVTMTDAASLFVGAATFEGITGAPGAHRRVQPRSGCAAPTRARRCRPTTRSRTSRVVEAADVFAIAPASANTIAKLAAGICDSFLTTLASPARRRGSSPRR